MTYEEIDIRTPEELEQLLFEVPTAVTPEDPIEVQREILRRIFASETPGQLAQTLKATPWQEHMGEPFEIRDFRLRHSSFNEGAAVFAVLDAIQTETGERLTLTCSGMNVLATIMQHKRMGWLPWRWRLTQTDRPTSSGYNVLILDDSGLGNVDPTQAPAPAAAE
ncbi:MAG: hypothetical protein ACRD2A_20810 [Vicinamibacterales bacterium]